VSIHPAFFSTAKQAGFTYVKKQLFNEKLYSSEQPEIHLEIGNDVWIGNNVSIMGGIKIGDGAIIGTKSLVTKNVEPYSIVGGVPAKILSKRFTDEEIGFLINAKWWEKDENWIIDNVDLFSNINNFIKHFHP
jgi:carbonic anhydrase/acetyltransferase-like protein (isoleucine patch superfamily)